MISTDLFIVTFAKDFPYLKYCLLSIGKFARRFNYLRVLVPLEDVEATQKLIDEAAILFPARAEGYEEKPGKGMLWHMRQILHADTFTDGQLIAHLDADCIFTEHITPEDFLHDGKVILRYEPFSSIGKRHDAMLRWQECTGRCLPLPVLNETMRCLPLVYHRSTYLLTRQMMEKKLNEGVNAYILRQENAFPQTWCEHNTLGNVAMELESAKYHCVKQTSDKPVPANKLQQFWSHGSIGQPQHIWIDGKQEMIVPIEFIEKTLAKHTFQSYRPTIEEIERMAQ